jgi:hypothetical protein
MGVFREWYDFSSDPLKVRWQEDQQLNKKWF